MKVDGARKAGSSQKDAKLSDPLVRLGCDENATPGAVNLEAMDSLFLVENPEVGINHEGHMPADGVESGHPEVVQSLSLYVIHEPIVRLEQVP